MSMQMYTNEIFRFFEILYIHHGLGKQLLCDSDSFILITFPQILSVDI